ncbi:MAG: hypothetical protein Q9163_001728 [Psora crenata]
MVSRDYVDSSTTHPPQNHSAQPHVVLDDDPTLDKIHDHYRSQIHRDADMEKGRDDEVLSSGGMTDHRDHHFARSKHPQVAKEPAGETDFELADSNQGTAFLTSKDTAKVGWFLVSVLPAVVFFVALVQILYYNDILPWFIGKAAVFFFWSLRVSGAEAVVAAASPFIGQGESAMLIKPFVVHLTQAELHQVMCSGFATIAGSVLLAYISLGVNPQALISSCVMSIPASLAISKLRYPETEETLTTGRVVIPDDDAHRAANSLHAFANGAWLGLKIAGMILATLLCIIALLGLANGVLTWVGGYLNINDPPLTVELIVGYICYPVAFLLGVPRNGDLLKVAKLIGTKLIANEFVAYSALQTDPAYADLSPRSRLIATYALCGFANIGSLGTQIGVLSQIAPGRSEDVSKLALSALITGALSTFTSASIAGLLIQDEAAYFNPGSGTG